MTALKALALAAFILVPGWLAASLLPERKGIGGFERLYFAAVFGTAIVFSVSLVLALASAYSLTALGVGVGAVGMALLAAARKRISWPAGVRAGEVLLALAVIAAALVLSVPPGRTVSGWSDVGVYADIAANIERTGGITVHSSTVREVAPERRELVYEPQEDPSQRFVAYENKAFLITDYESGTVVPIFYRLWPAALAVFASFLGPGMQFWAVTVMAVTALWGLLVLALRLLGRRWGLAAALMGALSPLYVYFSRYCTSEMMNLSLFLAAAFCLTAYLEAAEEGDGRGSRALSRASAFLFTLGFLCRIDFLVAAAPLLLFFLGKRIYAGLDAADRWFCSLTLAGAALATVIGMFFSAPYFFSVFVYLTRDVGRNLLLLGAGLALTITAFAFAPRLRGAARSAAKARVLWTAVLWLCLTGLFVYLYFLRPSEGDGMVKYGVINPTRGPSYISQTFVRWGWYFSLPGLIAIFIGYALWFSRRGGGARLPVAMMGLALTVGYGFDLRCTPLHIIAMRRLVPVVFPVGVIMAAYALRSLVDAGRSLSRRWRWCEPAGRVAAGALLLFLTLYAAGASVPIFGLEEGGNQLRLCGEIAERVEGGGVVLMDFHLGDHFGPPLRGFYGVENAWLMDNTGIAGEDFAALLEDLGFPAREAYLLWRPGMSGYHIPLAEGLELVKVAAFTSWEEALEKSFERRPAARRYESEEILLFRIAPVGQAR